jgi:aminoglycoside phosphotransferase
MAGLVRRSRGGVPPAVVSAALAAGTWECERALATVSDTAVLLVRTPSDGNGVLKVSATRSGMASLRQERDTLGRLLADERLGAWRALLPVPLGAGQAGGGAYLLTSRLPGRDGLHLAAGGLTAAAFGAIGPLHRATRTSAVAGEALLRDWVDRPAARIRAAVRCDAAVDALVAGLHSALSGRPVSLGWTHGDFFPGNVLARPEGQVTGIVDWSQARERDLPLLDLAFWLLTVPALEQGRELGTGVAARLASGHYWTQDEARLLADAGGHPMPGRALLLLAWLRHAAENLSKSRRYAMSPLWARRNVLPVLRSASRG